MPEPAQIYTQESYFASRFVEDPSRERLWRVLCEFLQQDVDSQGRVLELGGGYCYFINNIKAKEKHVIDLYDGIVANANPGVQAHVQSCTDLSNFPSDSLDNVFASNLFEHLTREELVSTLTEVRRVLKRGGRLLILQPNFKYCYRTYFDDYTHVQILTDLSLTDLLMTNGFKVIKTIPKFLPFSLKSRGPKWNFLLRLYLKSPWKPSAGQMYLVAQKPA